MNIAVCQPYGEIYDNDRLFDLKSCKIGQNLLLPGIRLQEKLKSLGHNYHTIDCYKFSDIDIIVFFEVPINSILTIKKPIDYVKYLLKLKFKNDYLLKSRYRNIKKVLVIQEPPVVRPLSYNKKFHKYFYRILTWKNELVDDVKYYKFYYPQVEPKESIAIKRFDEKRLLTMICGNKIADFPGELYSKRKELIEYFENIDIEFELYGFGWESENYKNYKGTVDNKIETLSNYKFSICFENMTNINGYITEKIFDSFFSNCVPIYYGANNITDLVPDNTFIDYRKYSSINELISFIKSINENEYNKYLLNIKEYLSSELYHNIFSIDAYVKNMVDFILK